MRASRLAWRVSGTAALFTAAVSGYDVVLHRWDWFPVMAVCTAMNAGWARYHYRRDHPAEPAHRPDYAKIRRLEIELGLTDPDPAPQPKRRPMDVTPGAPTDPRLIASQAGDQYVNAFREAQEAYAKWTVCPVCTRRHAGRCAG